MSKGVKSGNGGVLMKKNDFIEMLTQDLASKDGKIPYIDVVECVYLSLSEMPEDFDVDENITLESLYKMIYDKAKSENLKCIGPFVVAEMFAKRFGARYERPAKKLGLQKKILKVDFNDFI